MKANYNLFLVRRVSRHSQGVQLRSSGVTSEIDRGQACRFIGLERCRALNDSMETWSLERLSKPSQIERLDEYSALIEQ